MIFFRSQNWGVSPAVFRRVKGKDQRCCLFWRRPPGEDNNHFFLFFNKKKSISCISMTFFQLTEFYFQSSRPFLSLNIFHYFFWLLLPISAGSTFPVIKKRAISLFSESNSPLMEARRLCSPNQCSPRMRFGLREIPRSLSVWRGICGLVSDSDTHRNFPRALFSSNRQIR